jgi:hypothetical protein
MMTKPRRSLVHMLVIAVTLALCGLPQIAIAQSAATSQVPAMPAPEQSNSQANPGIVDPSKGPLQPVPPAGQLPEAPSAQAGQSGTPATAPSSEQQTQTRQPEGAAVGQRGITSGGPASTPAGTAIAPAKQHQYRSLLIKIGAVAAAGAAIGTVIALTKGSPSNPPGAGVR